MSYIIKQLGDESIIIITCINFNVTVDMPNVHRDVATLIQDKPGLFYRIVDLTEANFSFSGAVDGLLVASRSATGGVADPRTRTILVGTDEMTKLASEAFKQDQYGKRDVPMFSSLKAGIDYARTELKNSASS